MIILKTLTVTTLISLVSVELGSEFFTAVNTALNLATFIYASRIKQRTERIENVASTLDTRVEGGRRTYDPDPSE